MSEKKYTAEEVEEIIWEFFNKSKYGVGIYVSGCFDLPRTILKYCFSCYLKGEAGVLDEYIEILYAGASAEEWERDLKEKMYSPLDEDQIQRLRYLIYDSVHFNAREIVGTEEYETIITQIRWSEEWNENENKKRKKRDTYFTTKKSTRTAVFDRDGKVCAKCGSKKRLELDHIKPISMGGKDTLKNLQVLCKTCNLSKGAKVE